MHKKNIDSNLGPPVEIDSMMNGHWDRLTSQQRYVHIQHAWFLKPRFARNIFNLDIGVCLYTPKGIQIAVL